MHAEQTESRRRRVRKRQLRFWNRVIPPRWRKPFGGVVILVFLAVYVRTVMAMYQSLPDEGLLQLSFMAVACVAWSLPVIPMIRWMSRDK